MLQEELRVIGDTDALEAGLLRQRQIGGNPAGKAQQIRLLEECLWMVAKLELDLQIAQLIQWDFVFSFQITRNHFRAMFCEVSGQRFALSG